MRNYLFLQSLALRLLTVTIFILSCLSANASLKYEDFTYGDFKYQIPYELGGGNTVHYIYEGGIVVGVADGVNLKGDITIPTVVPFNGKSLSVVSIMDNAFMDQSGIESIEFGYGIAFIGVNAFKGCTALKVLDIPETMQALSISSFEGCTSLREINFISDPIVTQNYDNELDVSFTAFADCPVETLNVGRHLNISGPIEEKSMFPHLKSWSFAPNVDILPGYIFRGHEEITEFVVPSTIEEIGYAAFKDCVNLKQVILGDMVQTIRGDAFANCPLESLVLPPYLSVVEAGAFTGMPTLTELRILPCGLAVKNPLDLNDVFDSNSNIRHIEIGRDLKVNRLCPWPNVSEVILSEGLTVLNGYMLSGCPNVTELKFPASLTTISSLQLPNIKHLTITGGVTEISDGALSLPALTSLTFDSGDAPIHIGYHMVIPAKGMFAHCQNLTDVYISRNIEYDYYKGFEGTNYDKQLYAPFRNMNHLLKVFVSPDVTALDPGMFNDDKYTGGSCLTRVALPEDLDVNGTPYDKIKYPRDCILEEGPVVYSKNMETLYYVDHNYSGELTLPSGLRVVGASAANGVTKMSVKTLPSTLERIERAAFRNCHALGIKEMECPATLVSVGEEAFMDAGIETLTVNEEMAEIGSRAFGSPSKVVYKARNAAFIPYEGNNDVTIFNSFDTMVIEDGVESLPDWFAAYSYGKITFPSTLKSIGDYAFYYGGYTTLDLPESVESIGAHAFELCKNLTDFHFPASMTEIAPALFAKCTALESIVIPAEVTRIAEDAYDGCTAVTHIYVASGTEPLVSAAKSLMPICPSKKLLRVSLGRNYQFSNGTPQMLWEDKAPLSFVVGENVTSLYASNTLTPVKTIWNVASRPTNYSKFLGSKVNYVRSAGLAGNQNEEVCKWLSSMFEYDGIIYLLTSAKSASAIDCSYSPSVVSVEVPERITGPRGSDVEVESVLPFAFYGNPCLIDVTLKRSDDVGRSVFGYCTSLESVTLENEVENIGDYAFENCSSLKRFSAPKGVKHVGNSAFARCKMLESVEMPGICTLGNVVFSGCSSLTSISLPESLTSVGTAVFAGCSSLENVEYRWGVTALPIQFFQNCTSLKEIRIPSSMTSIHSLSFSGCTGVETIVVEPRDGNSFAFPSAGSSTTIFSEIPFKSLELYADVTLPTNNPFQSKSSLVSVMMGDEVTKVLPGMFSGCVNLTDVNIGDNVNEIGDRAFNGCFALEKLDFGLSSCVIGSYCAADAGLREIHLGAKTQKIGSRAFSGNPLQAVYCYASVPPVCGGSVFYGVDTFNCVLYVPQASVDSYSAAPEWEDFFDIRGLDDGEFPTGIMSPDHNANDVCEVNLGFSGDDLILSGCIGKRIMIMTLDGQTVYESSSAKGDVRFSLSSKGVYILRIGERTHKIMMR